jgi:hypothetical protein
MSNVEQHDIRMGTMGVEWNRLGAANGQVYRINKRMGEILEWLDRVRHMDKSA